MKFGMIVRLSLAVAGIAMAAAFASAQGPGMGPGTGMGSGFGQHRPPFERAFGAQGDHGRWWNNPKMVERLKLTDEQRKSMDDTLLTHREKLVDLRGSLEKAELELEPLMKADQPDEAKILAQIDTVAQARAELEKANARFLLAIRSKLTPEQWKQVQSDREHHAEDGHGGWGHDGQGQDGRGPGGPGRGGWGQGMQGPGMQGPGGQYHHHQSPPPGTQPPADSAPASPPPPPVTQ